MKTRMLIMNAARNLTHSLIGDLGLRQLPRIQKRGEDSIGLAGTVSGLNTRLSQCLMRPSARQPSLGFTATGVCTFWRVHNAATAEYDPYFLYAWTCTDLIYSFTCIRRDEVEFRDGC